MAFHSNRRAETIAAAVLVLSFFLGGWAHGQEDTSVADALSGQVVQLAQQGRFKEALPLAERCLRIYRSQYGEQHRDTAMATNNVAYQLKALGRYREALPYYEQSLKILRSLYGERHDDTAMCHDNLGQLLLENGDYAGALSHFGQSLQTRRQLHGEQHMDTAVTLGNVGRVYQQMGNFAAASPFYQQALNVKQSLVRGDHRELVVSLNNYADILNAQGDLPGARANYEQALAMNRRLFGEVQHDTADTLTKLSGIFRQQGDYVSAKGYLEKALQINRRLRGEEHPSVGEGLSSMGVLATLQKDYAGALPHFEQSLAISRKALGDDHIDTARALNNLGYLRQAQDDYAEAQKYFEQSLEIYKKAVGMEHPQTAMQLNNVGYVLQMQGKPAEARAFFEQSVSTYRKIVGDQHPSLTAPLLNLAHLEADAGRWESAADFRDQLRRGIRGHVTRVLPYLSEKEQLLFLENKYDDGFHGALSFGLLRAADPAVVTMSASWLLNGKAVGQEALATKSLMDRDLVNPQLKEIVDKLQQVRVQIAALETGATRKDQDSSRKELEALTAQEEALARERNQKAGGSGSAAWVEIDQLRKEIPADAVLIDIARFKDYDFTKKGSQYPWQPARYAAWIIPAAGRGNVQIVDLGLAEPIDAAVEKARKGIATAGEQDSVYRKEGEAAAEKQVHEDLQRVADLVWKPLSTKLGDAKRLLISPDGLLWLLPWNALPVTAEKCLLEQYPLHFVVSGRDLVGKTSANVKTSAPLVFADPDFGLDAEGSRKAIQAAYRNQLAAEFVNRLRNLITKTLSLNVARLPNTAAEAQAIAPSIAKYAKAEPQLWTDKNALEFVVKNVRNPTLLVLSTHGFFLPDQEVKTEEALSAAVATRAALVTTDGKQVENPLLRCGMLFTGCNSKQGSGDDDGILNGMEIVRIDLRGTDLVVLSACETGIGKVRNGEGVAGLRQAFQLAGAKSVVATLWQVPDRDSALIMNDFFANLADGQSKEDALRNAQIKRIEARRERYGAAHPFFWAAWTLTGE